MLTNACIRPAGRQAQRATQYGHHSPQRWSKRTLVFTQDPPAMTWPRPNRITRAPLKMEYSDTGYLSSPCIFSGWRREGEKKRKKKRNDSERQKTAAESIPPGFPVTMYCAFTTDFMQWVCGGWPGIMLKGPSRRLLLVCVCAHTCVCTRVYNVHESQLV